MTVNEPNKQENKSPITLLTGVQPSGIMHIGNYFGSIVNCKNSMNESPDGSSFFYMVADLHALGSLNAQTIKQNVFDIVSCYISCGISQAEHLKNRGEKGRVSIFAQSSVHQHSEAAIMLGSIAPLGMLERMTQFKTKAEAKESINLDLLSYPVLQAADILLYDADIVPVGHDQMQHIELTRFLANKYNQNYPMKSTDGNVFVVPKGVIPTNGRRIMSLADGTKKMSKSDGNSKSCIYLTDSNDEIALKIKHAKTDSISGIYCDQESRPEISNLMSLMALFKQQNPSCKTSYDDIMQSIENEYSAGKTAAFKSDLTNIIIDHLSPIRDKILYLQKNPEEVLQTMQDGRHHAEIRSSKTLHRMKSAAGMCYFEDEKNNG